MHKMFRAIRALHSVPRQLGRVGRVAMHPVTPFAAIRCAQVQYHTTTFAGIEKKEKEEEEEDEYDEDDDDVEFEFDREKIVVNSSRAAEPSSLDREKELFAIKRAVSAQYSHGNYGTALTTSQELTEKTSALYGKKNPVYASCLNNEALMHKMLGEHEHALNKYVEALHIYEDVQGKKSASYASTLCNLGSLYRLKAAESTGMMKHQNLLRAEEALTDALELRKEILGAQHRETITTQLLLAGLLRNQGKPEESLTMLQDILEMVKEVFSKDDLIVATTENNLGLTYKELKRYDDARLHYIQAATIRNKILGESHPDTIVSLHNLAECLHAMGRSEEAVAVQEKIVSLVEVMSGGEEGAAATPEVAPPAEPVTMPTPDPNLNFKTNPQLFSSQSPKKTNPTAAAKSQYQPVSRKKR